MPLEVKIDDNELDGFSEHAKNQLQTALKQHADDLISEAYRLEAGRNKTSGTPEITQGLVNDASAVLAFGYGSTRKSKMAILIRVLAPLSTLVVGGMWDFEKLKDSSYLVGFVIVLVVTMAINIFSVIKD